MAYKSYGGSSYAPFEPETEYVRTLLTELSFLSLRNYNMDEESLLADTLAWAWKSEPMLGEDFTKKMKEYQENAETYAAGALRNAITRLVLRAWHRAGVIGGSGQIIYINKKEREDDEEEDDEDTLEV